MEDGTRPIPGNEKKKGVYKFHRKYAGKEKNMTYQQDNLQIVMSRMDKIQKVKKEIAYKYNFVKYDQQINSRLWIGKQLIEQQEYEEHLFQFMTKYNIQTQKFFIQFARQNGQWPTQNLKRLQTTQLTTAAKLLNSKTKGLVNLGNTCYLNSALQCIFNTPFIRTYLMNEKLNYRRQINKQNLFAFNGFLIKTCERLLESVTELTGASSIAPRIFKKIISACYPQFRGNSQQDAQQFLLHLIDGLHEQVNLRRKPPYIQNPQSQDRDIRDLSLEFYSNHLRRNWSFFQFLFNGQFKNEIKCANCGKQSITFDPFRILSLPIQDKVQCTVKIQLYKLPPKIRDILSGSVSPQLLQKNDQYDNQSVITQLVESVKGVGAGSKMFISQSKLSQRNMQFNMHNQIQGRGATAAFSLNNSNNISFNKPFNQNNNKINLQDPSPIQLSFIFPRHTMGSDITKKLELLQDLDLLSPKYRNKIKNNDMHYYNNNIPQAYDIPSNVQHPQPIYQRLKHMTDIILYVAQGYSRPVVLGQLNSLSQLQNLDSIVLHAYQVLTPIGKDFIVKWYLDNEIYLKNLPDSPYQMPQKLLRIKNGSHLAANKRRQPHQPVQKLQRQQQSSSTHINNRSHQLQNSIPDSEKQLVSPSSYFNQSARFSHQQPDPKILFSNWVIVRGVLRIYSTIEDDIFAPRVVYKNDTVPLIFLVSKDITGYELYEEVYARMQHRYKPDSEYRMKNNLWWISQQQQYESIKNDNVKRNIAQNNSIDSNKQEPSQFLYQRKQRVSQVADQQQLSRKSSGNKIEDEKSKFKPPTKEKLRSAKIRNQNQNYQKDQESEEENITSGVGDQEIDDVDGSKKKLKKSKKILIINKKIEQIQRELIKADEDQQEQKIRGQQQMHQQQLKQGLEEPASQQKQNKFEVQKVDKKPFLRQQLNSINQKQEDINDAHFQSIASKIEKQIAEHQPFLIRMMDLDNRQCGVCKKFCDGCIVRPDYSQNQFEIQNYFNILIQMSYTNYSEHILETGVFSHSTATNIQKEKEERDKKNTSSLSTCLKRLTDKQVLQGKDAAYCSSCKQHQKHEKTLSVFRLPPILIFHFKRFRFLNQFHNSKITTIINFPLHGLNMNEFLDPDQEEVYQNYDLYAVLVRINMQILFVQIQNHYGSLNSGHYTACIMDEKGEWSYYDDSDIHPMPNSQEVRSQYAYMLFYKQRGIEDKHFEQIFPSLLQKFVGKPIKYKNKQGYICDKKMMNKSNLQKQNFKSYENKALIQSLNNDSLIQQGQKSIQKESYPQNRDQIPTELKFSNTIVSGSNKYEPSNQDTYIKICEKEDIDQVLKVGQDQLDKQVDQDFIENSEIYVARRSNKKEQDARLKEFLHEREENLQRDKSQQSKITSKKDAATYLLFSCNCSKKNKGDSKSSFNSASFRNEQSFS